MIERLLLLAAAGSLALAQQPTGLASTSEAGSAATTTGSSSSSTGTATSSDSAPVTHTVDVGLAGHTFQPDVTLANVGDIIEFNFFPTNHSVIRADYLRPCVPYEMTGRGRVGFYSDFLPVDAVLEDPPKWSLRVNDTDPIFYYCGADGSCINWQMVGVINPNATTSLEKQKQIAKDSSFMLLPGEKWPDEATDPMNTGAPTASGSGTTSPAATTSPDSDSNSSSSSSSSSSLGTGAIAGIAVGGTVAVIGVAALLFFCGRRSRRQRNNANAAQQPLMQQNGGVGGPGGPFSPQPHQGHMSYVQPYHDGNMNKHMSVQSHQMHSPALPGYIPPHGSEGAQTPLYGPSDALNPGATTDYTGSPATSPHMGAVGMGGAAAPAYSQRNSMQPQPFSPGLQSPHPYQPHPSPNQYPQQYPQHQQMQMQPNNFHEMPAAPVSDAQYQENRASQMQMQQQQQGGSELSGSETLGRGSPPPPQQQGGAGIMNFIKQNTGGK